VNFLILILWIFGIYGALMLLRILWFMGGHTPIGCPTCQTITILAIVFLVTRQWHSPIAPDYVIAMLVGMIIYFFATNVSNLIKKYKYKNNPENKNELAIKAYLVFFLLVVAVILWTLLIR